MRFPFAHSVTEKGPLLYGALKKASGSASTGACGTMDAPNSERSASIGAHGCDNSIVTVRSSSAVTESKEAKKKPTLGDAKVRSKEKTTSLAVSGVSSGSLASRRWNVHVRPSS